MIVNLKNLASVFLVVFFGLYEGVHNFAFASNLQDPKSLDDRDRAAFINFGDIFKESFKKNYPNFKIYSYCVGSFKDDGMSEYALGIVNLKEKKARYVVMLNNFGTKVYGIYLADYTLKNIDEKSETGPMVTCNSAMEIKRLNNSIKNSEGIIGGIKPINHFDSICIVDAPDGFENTCFSYDHKKRKFVDIGGWGT